MKKIHIAIWLSLSLVLALFCCACAQASEIKQKDSLLHQFTVKPDAVTVLNLRGGMDIDTALSKLGLTRDACKHVESDGKSYYQPLEGYSFSEFGNYTTDILLSFDESGLSNISYNVAFWNTSFEDAFKLAQESFESIDSYLNVEGYTFGAALDDIAEGDLLDQSFMKQWKIGDQNLYFSLTHQDWSNAKNHTDNESVVSIQFNIGF